MLRFFRKYMKYILAVFVALLMIAFLIQPTLSMFGPDPTKEVIGTIGSEKLTVGDQRQANSQILILEQLAPILANLANNTLGEPPSPLQWLLMLRDARSLGLDVSQSEIESLLETLGRSQSDLVSFARSLSVSVETVHHALRNWLIVQAYKELISGLIHVPVAQRVTHFATAGQFFQRGYYQGAMMAIESAFRGSPRLSRPLLERFLYDHRATVQISAVAIPGQRYLSQVEEPTDTSLDDLFDRYKTDLPDESEPYGMGYRIPDQVKLEYLSIPMDLAIRHTRVEEADALSYYDAHRDAFRLPNTSTTQPASESKDGTQPYEQVRRQIIAQLKREKAEQLADRMIKTAQGIMLENARPLAESGSYRTIPDNWRPISLDDVTQKLKRQFGFAPEIRRLDKRWLIASDLVILPDIGTSQFTLGQQVVRFSPYVLSAKELIVDNPNHSLAPLRLQQHLPSMPLNSSNGGRLLFRLIDAQASRVPSSLNEIRDQVVTDAKHLAAYELLQADVSTWLKNARDGGIEPWASKQNLSVITPSPFPKRISGPFGQLNVPEITGIGRSKVMVDAVFDLVEQLAQAELESDDSKVTAPDISQLPAAKRTNIVAVDKQMSLVVFRIDKLEPITKSQYERLAQSPQLGAWINQALTVENKQDPLSIASLSKRVAFVPAYPDKSEPSDNTTENEPTDELSEP